jgi:hypothetical protein
VVGHAVEVGDARRLEPLVHLEEVDAGEVAGVLGRSVADLGELVASSVRWIGNFELVPGAAWLPGLTVFGIVLAFNLFGDSLRDALDPKSER